MVKLNDYFSSDLNVFFNPDEFGEWHKLDSKEILMIVSDDSFDQRGRVSQEFDDSVQNLYQSNITLYLKATDFKKPKVGKRLKFDGELYYVAHSSVTQGVLKIELDANEAYG